MTLLRGLANCPDLAMLEHYLQTATVFWGADSVNGCCNAARTQVVLPTLKMVSARIGGRTAGGPFTQGE